MKHILRLGNYCKNTITSTQPTFLPWRFGLYQRPSSDEVCSILLPVLAMMLMRRGKKSVVHVAQRVAPLVPVQGLLSFYSEKKDGNPWTGTRGATRWATRATDFLPLRLFLLLLLSWQEPEEELNKLLLIRVSDRDRNVKVKNVGCVEVIVFLQCVKLFEVLADWTDDCVAGKLGMLYWVAGLLEGQSRPRRHWHAAEDARGGQRARCQHQHVW